MLLSDATILRNVGATGGDFLTITPFDEALVQPCSVDVRLGSHFRSPREGGGPLDPYEDNSHRYNEIDVEPDRYYLLCPGQFVLATTVERLGLPAALQGRLEGKSSLARLGLAVHSTGGFIDPGFEGEITLELTNDARWPIKLWPGMRIAQLAFTVLDRPAVRPYGHKGLGSKYQGQTGATASAYHLNAREVPTS